jgi:hypothetical protein
VADAVEAVRQDVNQESAQCRSIERFGRLLALFRRGAAAAFGSCLRSARITPIRGEHRWSVMFCHQKQSLHRGVPNECAARWTAWYGGVIGHPRAF